MEKISKYDYNVDIPVLLIFFCRDEQLKQVFDEVKKARPSKLYLYQDGARKGKSSDIVGIEKCRNIVSDENVDWNCEVHRFYQEKNIGCDPSEFIAQKWMFETEEMGIILEDDDVPSQSFFRFCKELLVKYQDNPQINMICGMNNNDVSKNINASYLFTKKGSIWGWASWKRVIDTWDESYSWLENQNDLDKIKTQMSKNDYKNFIEVAKKHKSSGRAHYESINAASMFIYNRLNIVPKYNMITNIGISKDSTHAVSDIRLLPKKTQKLLHKKRYDIEFPLIHPDKIDRDFKFERKMTVNKADKIIMKIESLFRSVLYLGIRGTVIRAKNKKKKGIL